MRKLNFKNFKSGKLFVIAEIGHNHQGSVEIAKKLILRAKESGANAVKFQKRSNKNLYTKEFFDKPYDHPNSFAKTYGLHREHLELDFEQYKQLQRFAKKLDIIFFATPFDFESVDFLEKIKVPCYKIASGDLTNTPLQEYIARKNKIIFLSTGGGKLQDIVRAYKNIIKINKKLIILHCTASYPARIEDMNLNIITEIKKKFKNIPIGLSDHENGIDAASVAYMLGARTFEKHFTLNRAMKGTDNQFSLEPIGLSKLVRNLQRIPKLLGNKKKILLNTEKNSINKMAKSIVASRNIKKNSILKLKDLAFRSPGDGLRPYEYKYFLNKKITVNLIKDQKLKKSFVKKK